MTVQLAEAFSVELYLLLQFADLPAIGLSVCKALTFTAEYDKIMAGRDDALGSASPL
mgnify:FL=1